jgi:hypothetical protein
MDKDADEDDDYDDGANDNDNDDEAPGEADAPPEDENSHRVRLLAGVVCTNQDYGLGHTERLPDASVNAPAVFEVVKL